MAYFFTDEIDRGYAEEWINFLNNPNEKGLVGYFIIVEKNNENVILSEDLPGIPDDPNHPDSQMENYQIPIKELIELIHQWVQLSNKCNRITLTYENGIHSLTGEMIEIDYTKIDRTIIITQEKSGYDYESDGWAPFNQLALLLITIKNKEILISFLRNPDKSVMIKNDLKIEKRNDIAIICGESDSYKEDIFEIPIDKLLHIIDTWNRLRAIQCKTMILRQLNGIITLTEGKEGEA